MAITPPEDRKGYTPEEDALIFNRIEEAKRLKLDMMPVYEKLAEEVGSPSGGAIYQVYRRMVKKREKEEQEAKMKELEQRRTEREQRRTEKEYQQEKEIPSLEEWKAKQRAHDEKEAELKRQLEESQKQELQEQMSLPVEPAEQPASLLMPAWKQVVTTGNPSTSAFVYQYPNTNAIVPTPTTTSTIYPNPTYGYMPGLLQERDQLKAELEAAKEIIRELEGRLATIRYITERG